jgi:predicted secreted acid phosphatase
MGNLHRLGRSGRVVNIVVAVLASLVSASIALAASSALTYTPQKADQITNIDILRTQIASYYDDPAKTGTFGADSNYAREAESVAAAGSRWLQARAHKSAMPAIVLDVDDTTLTTWNYEVFSNWAYNPTTNLTFVTGQLFPATPGMVAMVTQAAAEGYAVFFITGRPTSQYDATLGNLTSDGIGVDAGYPVPTALFTKPSDPSLYPAYLTAACSGDPGGKCTTIHYKSATRAYIESMGYDIVANFGDQYSDLKGGYADNTFKMPNPNYYLP